MSPRPNLSVSRCRGSDRIVGVRWVRPLSATTGLTLCATCDEWVTCTMLPNPRKFIVKLHSIRTIQFGGKPK